VLGPTKTRVLETNGRFQGKLENLDPLLRSASGYSFYNTSRYDFDKLLADAPTLAANLRNYIAGFSPNMREVIEKFDFDNTITKLADAGLLFLVMERFRTVELHPDVVDNATMGTIFEELIRKFNEALNENPGEHFTPRDVVHLMVDLLLAGDAERIRRPGAILTVCDPCCGTGGMLTITKEHITQGVRDEEARAFVRPSISAGAEVHLFGQEVNPETFAVCKSDLYMKSADGRDAEHILYGTTLGKNLHAARRFDYLIANPPYGKDWKRDEEAVKDEYARGAVGRFAPGLPRISDGQLLFLLHMLHHAQASSEEGTRIAIIMNGSPLFTGDAGSGESEIRRFVLENDWLEALIALPEQLFYNTGIATYIWVLSNRKPAARRGQVMLIDATSFWTPRRKSLGDKRRDIPLARADAIVAMLDAYTEGAQARIFPTTHFGYRKITVERPLRLNFQASPDRIARLETDPVFRALAESKKKGAAGEADADAGREQQAVIRRTLATLPADCYPDRAVFERVLDEALRNAGVKLAAPLRKAVLSALGERDATAAICRDAKGNPEADPDLRDTENAPLREPVEAFFAREVAPHAPDAWIDAGKRDAKDGGVGIVGYEINFNRYFYQYTPPRPLEAIETDIRQVEQNIIRLLAQVTGSRAAE
jgi:type I restriction enzyme M protein